MARITGEVTIDVDVDLGLEMDIRRALVFSQCQGREIRVVDQRGLALTAETADMIDLAHRILQVAGNAGGSGQTPKVVRLPVLGRIGGDDPEAA